MTKIHQKKFNINRLKNHYWVLEIKLHLANKLVKNIQFRIDYIIFSSLHVKIKKTLEQLALESNWN